MTGLAAGSPCLTVHKASRIPAQKQNGCSCLRQCGSNIYQQSHRKAPPPYSFFFFKKLTSFLELACFSLVTLSFEMQPREAIPVEIKTDM